MVGLPYDCLANPLGAVRLTFEKALSSGLNPSTSNGSDWGAIDVFRQFLSDDGNISQVFQFELEKQNPIFRVFIFFPN